MTAVPGIERTIRASSATRGQPIDLVRATNSQSYAEAARGNLHHDELTAYRLLADEYLSLDGAGLTGAQATGAIIEVNCDDEAIQK